MLFMLVSRPKPGTTRQQLVDSLLHRLQPGTWDLIRQGAISNVLYKVGDEPGFFAVLQAASLEAAKTMVAARQETTLPFEIDIVPVNQFPHFD
jgi:hypothetical protein